MSFNKFAAGRKVYGQGATSPTRGQVDPSGYIKRELARRSNQQGVSKVGNDGQSDTRSGIAHRAIGNSIGNNVGRPPAGNIRPPRQPSGGQVNMPQFNGSRPTRPITTPGTATTPDTVAPVPVQPIQVNPNGILELPYNSDYYNQAVDAQQEFDREVMNMGIEDQQQNLEYEQFMRELEKGYVDRQRGTLNNSAGRGTLYSSAYSTGVNEDALAYNNSKNDAVAQDKLHDSNQATRRNFAQQALNQLIQRITQGYADSLAADAGNLGYGVSNEEGVPGAPVSAPYVPGAPIHIPGNIGNNVARPQAGILKPPPKPPGGGSNWSAPKGNGGGNGNGNGGNGGGKAHGGPVDPPKKKGKK